MRAITIEDQAAVDAMRDTVFNRVAKGLMTEDMSYPEFVRASWPILEPTTEFKQNWHIDCIAEHLQAVDMGQINRLIINMPPRHMKSILTTCQWPAWSWTQKPWLRWIFCSYSSLLAVKHSVERRRIIESDFYKERWGNIVNMAPDQNQKAQYQNTATGLMFSTSTGGSLTGMGGDRIVVDDILNPQKAESDADRRKAIDFYINTLSTRLNDKRTGAIIIVEQRLHDKDLSGHILKNETGWIHLDLQAVQERESSFSFPVSGRVVERKVGDLLWPEKEDGKILERQKMQMGPRAYGAQYQQRPKPDAGNILQRQWFKRWNTHPQRFDFIIHSWDFAFKDLKASSFVVGQVWGKIEARKYLLAQIRAHLNFPKSVQAALDLLKMYPQATAVLMEDKANGPAIISTMQQRVPRLIPVRPDGTKVARASAISGHLEGGNIYIPGGQHIPAPDGHEMTAVDEFLDECAAFPLGDFDDQVDAMTQGVTRLINFEEQMVLDEGEEGSDPFGLYDGQDDEEEGQDIW